MGGPGKSREEVERELLARLELAKNEYDTAKREHARLWAIAEDTGVLSRDGYLALDQAHEAHVKAMRARNKYQDILHAFTEFVISGKLPE